MTLLDPDLHESHYAAFDRNTVIFLKSIKHHYTRETAGIVLDKLTEVFGREWKDRIIFGMVAGAPVMNRIYIQRNHNIANCKKIMAIKMVRSLSGTGLVESKNLVERAEYQLVEVNFRTDTNAYSENEWDRIVQESISELTSAGYTVSNN